MTPKNACSLCHRDLRQAALAALTHHVWCQCCTPPKTSKNRLFARLSETPSEPAVEIAIIDYPADKIRYATTRAIDTQPMPETRRDLLELRRELEARGALVAVHELEGSLSN